MTHTTSPAAWGVDGCKAGWFWFRLPVSQSVPITWGVANTLEALLDGENRTTGDDGVVLAGPAEGDLMLVDMPIGLPNADSEGRKCVSRDCDRQARRQLKERWRSVFAVPTREAMTEFEDHYRAQRGGGQKDALKQAAGQVQPIPPVTAGIFPKLFEVDRLMRTPRSTSVIVRETHPEVCFWALHGKNSMPFGKKHGMGFVKRLDLLEDLLGNLFGGRDPGAKEIVETACLGRPDVGSDDIVDALACAVTAWIILHDKDAAGTLPHRENAADRAEPPEMVYAVPPVFVRNDSASDSER